MAKKVILHGMGIGKGRLRWLMWGGVLLISLLTSPLEVRAEMCTEIDYNKPTIAAGAWHTAGIKEDGTVVATGGIDVSDWTNIKAIAASSWQPVGLREDGTVVAVGDNPWGQLNVSDWTNIKAISAGAYHTVGLKEDGTVVGAGLDWFGQLNVADYTNIKAISAGAYHTVGLKEDGTVVGVGLDWSQANVADWTNIKAIAAGGGHTVGLKEDGTVVATGGIDVSDWTDITAIAAGWWHTVGLKANGTVVGVGENAAGQINVSAWTNIRQPTTITVQDTTPPVTTATGGSDNWYNANVISTFSATYSCSGVKEIRYSINGVETVIPGNSASLTLTADGIYNVAYYSIDNAGNAESPKSMTVKIDKTPPVLNLSTNPNTLWPSNHKMVDVLIGGSATDATSGIASVAFTVTDEYGIVQPSVGNFNTTIQLEAWRKGTDKDGRHYIITAVAADAAGNKTTASTTVLVPHNQGK